MADQTSSAKRWNLFARELENILATHHLGLGHLDDRAGIHREKVRRLIQSLSSPKSFPVLNVEEMEQVIRVLQFNEEEVLHLRAALLATSIEKTLMDRIEQDDALLASEQVFPIILKALQEQLNGVSGLGVVKKGDGEPGTDYAGKLLDSVWQAIDTADMALHMSYRVYEHTERVEKARYAHTRFTEALAELEEVADRLRTLPIWQYCDDTAQKGLAAASERLEDLGE
jgi:hypothetical protein